MALFRNYNQKDYKAQINFFAKEMHPENTPPLMEKKKWGSRLNPKDKLKTMVVYEQGNSNSYTPVKKRGTYYLNVGDEFYEKLSVSSRIVLLTGLYFLQERIHTGDKEWYFFIIRIVEVCEVNFKKEFYRQDVLKDAVTISKYLDLREINDQAKRTFLFLLG